MADVKNYQTVGVVGAGTMGAGIAQLAASHGHKVKLFDVAEGAAQGAIEKTAAALARLVERGKKTAAFRETCLSNLQPVSGLTEFADCSLVIEAVVENIKVKHSLLQELESIVGEDAVLASNTSSISITEIASETKRPERVVGMHFFNPAPVMKLVEVVRGLQSDPSVVQSIFELAASWGKQPILAKSTPGFVANRVARPYYAEALKMLEEGIAQAPVVDAILKDCAGFRMGPFELMDLIGVDVNYAVTQSVFEAMYYDPKFKPSLLQKEMVGAGLLGRKTGHGFYRYHAGKLEEVLEDSVTADSGLKQMVVAGDVGPLSALVSLAEAAGVAVSTQAGAGLIFLSDGVLALSDGRSATLRSRQQNLPNLVLLDWVEDFSATPRVAVAAGDLTNAATKQAVNQLFAAVNKQVHWLDDLPGLVVLRTVCMLANEGADTVANGVCQSDEVDKATRFGLNYPKGPLAWADELGLELVASVVRNLHDAYGDDHYRVSRLLQRKLHGAGKFFESN